MSSLLKHEDGETAEELRQWLAGQKLGSMAPVTVLLRRDENSSGREAWFYDVVLPNPDPVEGTWPIDDLIDLELLVRDEALKRGLSWPWYVFFQPETDDPHEYEDEDEPDRPPR
jgi:hypothetical protein